MSLFDVYEHPDFSYHPESYGARKTEPALYVVGIGLAAIGGAIATYAIAPERVVDLIKQVKEQGFNMSYI